MHTLNCHGHLIDLSLPKVMGIINITPDSFYDGGKSFAPESILRLAKKMLAEGADFLDIGGYSSRRGADNVSENEEISRVTHAIELILKEFPSAIISIDTFRSRVAREAVAAGAAMVNDISAGTLDSGMLETVGKLKVPYIAMHMRGTPQTMAKLNQYENVTQEVIKFLSLGIAKARAAGMDDIIIDPGFGFAKNREQSFEMLQNLELFHHLEVPLLVGISRKSFIYKSLDSTAQDALNGTTALHAIALQKGAHILRVHDVKEAVECVKLIQKLHFKSGDV